jgi:hypothetical protein
MDLDFYQFTELIDIKLNPGSQFVHSMSEPFSEEDIEDEVMHNWIDHFKMRARETSSQTPPFLFSFSLGTLQVIEKSVRNRSFNRFQVHPFLWA